MLGESHDLPDEFPEYRDLMLQLKKTDSEFGRLFDEYHEINDQVIRIEQCVENHSDAYTEDLKKKRVLLKDMLYERLLQGG